MSVFPGMEVMYEHYDRRGLCAMMAAGSPDDKSRAAATAMSTDILEMKRDVNLLKWMVGLNIAVSMIPALKAILG